MVVEIHANVGKNRLFIRIEGRLDGEDAKRVADTMIKEMDRLRPGFDVVSDLTKAEPMGPEGSVQLKRVLQAQRDRQYGRAVRIVGKSAAVAVQFERDSKEYRHEPYLAFSLEEAEQLLDGLLP